MAVMDYRRLGHQHNEFPHVQRQNIRGQSRKRNRRKTQRIVKRWDQHAAAREVRHALLEYAQG